VLISTYRLYAHTYARARADNQRNNLLFIILKFIHKRKEINNNYIKIDTFHIHLYTFYIHLYTFYIYFIKFNKKIKIETKL